MDAPLDAATPFVPLAPVPPARPLSAWRTLRLMRRNILETWPRAAYEERIVYQRLFGTNVYIVNDPPAVRHVLTGNAAGYERPVRVRRQLRPGMGEGLLLSEGEVWRRKRRMLAPSFTPQRVGQLIPHFAAAAEALVARCGSGPVNLAAQFHETALDALCRALFSVPAGTPGTTKLPDLVREYLVTVGRPSLWDLIARNEGDFAWFGRGRAEIGRRWFAEVETLLGTLMAARQEGGADQARDVLDLLRAARDPESGAALTLAEIRDEVATVFGAGFETAARTMFWSMYLLSHDRAAQDAIAAELAAFPPSQVRRLADHRAWPALRRTLLEALRLFPPAPWIMRVAVRPDHVDGADLRPGDHVIISPWLIHRHRRFWNAPEAFTPARFLGREEQPGENWLPFGAGPHICLGAAFATTEAMTILAVMLARFEVSLDDPRPVYPTVAAISTTPSIEPLFRLTPRRG